MASILEKISRHFEDDGTVQSMALLNKVVEVLSVDNEFTEEVLNSFSIKKEDNHLIHIGNVKSLLEDISDLDSKAEKIDVRVKVKDIYLEKMLEDEVAQFMLYGIDNPILLKRLGVDNLLVETRYSAKYDVLDFHHFSKFANFCRDLKWDDLISYIQDYIQIHTPNDEYCSARLIRPIEDDKYLLRAVTSDKAYKNYGINFSLLVALLAVDQYVKEAKDNVYIDNYHVDDSTVYVSFQLGTAKKISDNMELSFNLILENDEIKDSAVSFNALFRLTYKDGSHNSYVYLRPKAFKDSNSLSYKSDMLTYTHSMNVNTVYKKIQQLPLYIGQYVEQIIQNASNILNIKSPEEVREFIATTVRNAKDKDFSKYKADVLAKLMSIEANSIFDLFEALRSVDELFGDDIVSKNYWRTKLYKMLLERNDDKK